MSTPAPESILRHAAPDRVFHWFNAACVLVLTCSAVCARADAVRPCRTGRRTPAEPV